MLNRDLRQHPTIFVFMNQLRCSVFQQGISIVALNHAGKNPPSRSTIAAKRLADRAQDVEEQYLQGLITPTEVLLQAATHYSDNLIQDSMQEDSNQVVKATYAGEDNHDLPQSQDPALKDPILEDERRIALDEDEGLTDMGNEEWIATDWKSQGKINWFTFNFF